MGGASSSSQMGGGTTIINSNTINPLMCLSIAEVLPHPMHHAYLRSAGCTGLRIYEELILLRKIPCCLEHPKSTEPADPLPPPPRLLSSLKFKQSPTSIHHQLIPIHISTNKPQQGIVGSLLQSVLTTNTSKKVLKDTSTLVVFPDVVYRSKIPLFKNKPIPTIKCLRYSFDATAKNLPDLFGDRIPNADTIILEGFDSVTSIGHQFHGYTVKTIDLSALHHAEGLSTISGRFLYQCKNLVQVDLSPLIHVTAIGNNFMDSCESLQTIDLSPLSNVVAIGQNFLAYTKRLRTVEFGGDGGDSIEEDDTTGERGRGMGSNLTTIGDSFLMMATSLENVDLKNFTKIKAIGKFFLSQCKSLRYVDLRPLGDDIERIEICLMYGCSDITIDHPPGLTKVCAATILKNSTGRITV